MNDRHQILLAALLAAAPLTTTTTASASDPPANEPPEAPYAPWTGPEPYRTADPRAPREPPPPPLVAEPEQGRRPFEIGAGLGLGLPRCSRYAGAHCAAPGSDLVTDATGVYRVTPYFACGADFSFGGFGSDGKLARTSSHFVGVLGRVYLLAEGWFDPYLELSLGGGSLRTSGREPKTLVYFEDTASGPAARAGAGFYLSLGRLRLGPAVDWTGYASGSVRRCTASGTCVESWTDGHPHPSGFLSLTLRLGIALGRPM